MRGRACSKAATANLARLHCCSCSSSESSASISRGSSGWGCGRGDCWAGLGGAPLWLLLLLYRTNQKEFLIAKDMNGCEQYKKKKKIFQRWWRIRSLDLVLIISKLNLNLVIVAFKRHISHSVVFFIILSQMFGVNIICFYRLYIYIYIYKKKRTF